MQVFYLELTMPKATVAQRQRIIESLDEKVLYTCIFVSSVKDAWYKLTASGEDAALRRNKYTFAAEVFVLQKTRVFGGLLGSLGILQGWSFCKRNKQIYTDTALRIPITYLQSYSTSVGHNSKCWLCWWDSSQKWGLWALLSLQSPILFEEKLKQSGT